MSKIKKEVRKLPKLYTRAQFSPASYNEEDRTIEVTWTTGYKGLRSTREGDYYEELSLDPAHVRMDHLKSGRAKFLAAHNMRELDSVLGKIVAADIGSAKIQVSRDDISERNLQKIRDGILTDVSVGYLVHTYDNVTKKGDAIRTYRAVDWTPVEISLVPTGFDPGAVVREETLNENDVEIITRSDSYKEIPEMDEQEKARLEQEKLENAKKEAAELAATAERTRASEIRTLVRDAKQDEKMSDEFISNGSSVQQVREAIQLLEKYAKSPATQVTSAVTVQVGEDRQDQKRSAIEASLIHRVDRKGFDSKVHSADFLGMSMVRLCEEMLGGRKGLSDADIVKRAMSTSDLPKILANVAEKSAARQYAVAKQTFSPWTASGDLRNYKPHKQVKLGDFSSLEKRNEKGEFKYGSMGEEQEQAQLEDFGKILKLTKQMMINDDLGVLSQIISKGGIAARRLESKAVYNVLLDNGNMDDGVALFHASHGNLGSAAAIGDAAMALAFKAMREQKTVDDEDNLELAPAYLIVGPSKENEARKFLSAILANQTSNVNIYSNSLQLIVENRISGNKWFLAADPSTVDTVTLFKLTGQENPVISTRENWSDSSMEFKVEHTIDAAAMDYRGLYYNPGA